LVEDSLDNTGKNESLLQEDHKVKVFLKVEEDKNYKRDCSDPRLPLKLVAVNIKEPDYKPCAQEKSGIKFIR